MGSKQLQSILKNIPSATAKGENTKTLDDSENATEIKGPVTTNMSNLPKRETVVHEKTDRLVAEIPRSLKKQIRSYIENNEGMTEKSVILKALKAYGFDIDDSLILDKRTTR